MKAGLTAGGEYYIWLNIYEKLLGTNETGNGPALSAFGTKSDGYVFVAEATGENDYFYLKQKSSGRYLAANSSNTWSIVFEDNYTNDNRFRWKMTGYNCYAYLINKKNEGKENKYVGIDGANKGSSYVSIYYDKRKSSHGQFSIIPATGNSWEEARQAYESGVYINDQKVQEIDYCQLKDKTIDRSDAVDIHITSNDNPMLGSSSVNLGSDRTWLIFDNIVPSKVISTYLQYVTIDGASAVNGENCRVVIYLNGAAVIPLPEIAMTCDGTEGEFDLAVGNHANLGEQSNTMTSFTLRRGYMVTLATEANGSGHSRVFVADHADKVITLSEALSKRVTSAYVKPWQYVSKKGWADTGGATKGPQLRATWFWSWSAGYKSTTDMEYVPCRQHRYWPSASEVNSKTGTASLSINEPEHSEQHTSDKCTCGGTMDAWTTYGFNSSFQAGGGRIGSPQPTDLSYLTTYFGYVDKNNNQSRCDFAVTHAYWDIDSKDANSYAKYVTDQCWNIWSSTGRPVWLTEMEAGASWSNYAAAITSYDKAREYLQAMLQRLEESDDVERYAIYSFDYWRNYMFRDDGSITPAGEVYRDHRSTFAYTSKSDKAPAWWEPSLKTPELTYEVNLDERTITFTVSNTNGDSTDDLLIEYQPENGNWQTLADLGVDRSKLENNSLTYTKNLSDLDVSGGKFRVSTTTLYGKSATSSEVKAPIVSDLETLLPLIAETEALPFGFGRGEYAPYNNVEALQALAVVKAMKPYEADFQTSCQTLANAVWVPNTVELDAVYDGQFANTEANATSGNINLPGWTKVEGIRLLVKNLSKDPGLAYTDGKAAVFAWGGTTLTYGEQAGYTLPMNKHSIYELTLKVSGWRDGDLPSKFAVTFDGETQEITPSVKRINNSTENPFQTLTFNVTPTADNSILKLYANHHFTIADVSLRKAAEYETVSVGETGYATYVSGNDLDFSETAIKAYKAAFSEGFVVLTPISKVKAGTPVVLYYKGGNKEENIPFATSVNAATGNLLKAGEGKAVASDGGNGVVNCILNKVGGQIGFYRANGQVVAWNRAYLPVSTNASRFDIVFDNETTGTSIVKSEGVKSEKMYNLNGQRISLPKHGVYVVSGKKVIK